jgi:hypothetical protein
MVLVLEHALEADGAAGGVDLVVDHRQDAVGQVFLLSVVSAITFSGFADCAWLM